MDDKNKRLKAQRNQEPETIDIDTTGTVPGGNYRGPEMSIEEQTPRIEATGLIWIEQEDQAKQKMARKGDMRNARAGNNRIQFDRTKGNGGIL